MKLSHATDLREATAFFHSGDSFCTELSSGLTAEGLSVLEADAAESFLTVVRESAADSALIDLRGDSSPGMQGLHDLRRENPDIGIVVITATEDLETTRQALAAGADDFLVENHGPDLVAASLRLVAGAYRLKLENRSFLMALEQRNTPRELIGCSPVIRRLQAAVERASENDATILIEGKPGTGKSMIARMVHDLSGAEATALNVLDCEGLAEERLLACLSEPGIRTLLLEDIDRLSAQAQAVLVRALKELQPDEASERSGHARIIATTKARLAELTAKGSFREDLYYRLNVFPLAVPALQERQEDIAALANHLLDQACSNNEVSSHGFSPAAMILLESHPWPENVTQLKNVIMRGHALAGGEPIDRMHLMGPVSGVGVPSGVAGMSDVCLQDEDESISEDDILPFQDEEKRILGRALKATKGNVRRAAQLLCIGRATLYRKIQVYDLRLQ
ncbi:MAG: sigma-54-dependent transcriptional regulator [Planctomycetota bacterium]|jgi:DNA-binding NtrC family response regulator